MKKSLLLFSMVLACSLLNKLHAQASETDTSFVNENLYSDKPLTKSTITPPPGDFTVTTGFSIYPNPVRDVLKIDGIDASVKTQIGVSSLYGKVIFQSRSSGSDSYTANVSKLKPGIYYVTIKEKGKSVMLKFIKQ